MNREELVEDMIKLLDSIKCLVHPEKKNVLFLFLTNVIPCDKNSGNIHVDVHLL